MQKTRLHKVITSDLDLKKDYTKTEIMSHINQHGVYINGDLAHNRLQWITDLDKISTDHWPEKDMPNLEGIKIIKESQDWLIVYKPGGIPVHHGAGYNSHTLLDWLLENYPQQQKLIDRASNDNNFATSGGMVHRIDKDTQGLILIAHDEELYHHFQNQFRDRMVTKKYLCKVSGKLDSSYQDIAHYQSRDKREPRRQKLFWNEQESLNYHPESRNAMTSLTPICYCPDLDETLVEARIKTGRMHQIRILCESLSHPIVGEKIYTKTCKEDIPKLGKESTTPNTEQARFESVSKDIFLDNTFCLVSNYLKISDMNDKAIEAEYYDIKSNI